MTAELVQLPCAYARSDWLFYPPLGGNFFISKKRFGWTAKPTYFWVERVSRNSESCEEFLDTNSLNFEIFKLQTSFPMNNQSRIDLLKEVKSAVNTASFAPTSDRIEDAKKAVQTLMSYVESLEAPKPKRRRKTKQKSSKATPATKVADKQEKAFHGKADSPVTPSTRKPKASVEAARKSAHDVSRHTGAESRAKRKAELVAEAIAKEAVASSPAPVTSSDDRVASLEARLEVMMAEYKRLTDTLLVMSTNDVMSTANEVCFSDLPFDPTSNL